MHSAKRAFHEPPEAEPGMGLWDRGANPRRTELQNKRYCNYPPPTRPTPSDTLIAMKIFTLILAACLGACAPFDSFAADDHKNTKECLACCKKPEKCDACCHDKGKGEECRACCGKPKPK
jgi:hypothetical protein